MTQPRRLRGNQWKRYAAPTPGGRPFYLLDCPQCGKSALSYNEPNPAGRLDFLTCKHCRFAGPVLLGGFEPPNPIRSSDPTFDHTDTFGT